MTQQKNDNVVSLLGKKIERSIDSIQYAVSIGLMVEPLFDANGNVRVFHCRLGDKEWYMSPQFKNFEEKK
jgi:hypothetical protein